MPTASLTTAFLTTAIVGIEEKTGQINARIAKVRAMLTAPATNQSWPNLPDLPSPA